MSSDIAVPQPLYAWDGLMLKLNTFLIYLVKQVRFLSNVKYYISLRFLSNVKQVRYLVTGDCQMTNKFEVSGNHGYQ